MGNSSSYATLIKNLGFNADPFAKTNADEEERLDSYFIQPPFYSTVFGDPASPKSTIVFAPRGGGKTALKRKIEIASVGSKFLCITYNTFPIQGIALKDISADYHLQNIIRLLLIGVIGECNDSGLEKLSNHDRHFLYLFSKLYFSDLDRSELKDAIGAVKSLSDKAREWWNKFTGPIGLAVNALLHKLGIGSAEIKKFEQEGGLLGSYPEQFKILRDIVSKLGKHSIYILVDRVDELSITNTGSASYEFIAPLLTDLHLLEIQGFAFKFFLWDMLLENYRVNARPDRITYHSLAWTHTQLRQMISERLKAYSNKKVTSFGQLFEVDDNSIDRLIIYYASGSPRMIIRMCKEIVDQQSEIDDKAKLISPDALYKGIEVFASNFAHETMEQGTLRELKKLRKTNFTVKHVYSNVFKFSQQAGITKVKQWQDAGIVERVGTVKEGKAYRPSNVFGLTNPLIGKHLFGEMSASEFCDKKLRVCTGCAALLIRDWDQNPKATCHRCDRGFNLSSSPSS